MNFITSLLVALFFMTITSFSRADALLKGVDGQSISFGSLKGKWVFINYWAGWCQTCLEEIPEFNHFYHSHINKSVALFAVNYDALPLNKLKRLIKKYNIKYPGLINDPSQELHLGSITGVPVTFVFNPQGRLVKTLYGGQSAVMLRKAMK